MRHLVWLILIIVVLFAFGGCNEDGLEYKGQSRLVIYSSTDIPQTKSGQNIEASEDNTLIFTGEDILWYDESTEEIRFREGTALKSFQENWASHHYATICLENEVLFTIPIIKSSRSLIYDDLTLIDKGGYKYYLGEGYPNSSYGSPLKKKKRAEAWEKFIDQLKAEGRYKK